MQKLRDKIESKDQWKGLLEYVDPLEVNININNNITLDNAKSLLESLAKTILHNKGVVIINSDFAKIVKQALSVTPIYLSLNSKDQQNTKKIVSGISSIISSIGEFRNSYGFLSHGNDIHGEKFDLYLTHLVVDSTESLALFLINAHSQDLHQRKRFFYDDYSDFNDWYDEKESIMISGVAYSASKTLYDQDEIAYKEAMIAYSNNPEALIESLDDPNVTEKTIQSILDVSYGLDSEQLQRIQGLINKQQKIFTKINTQLTDSGFYETIEKLSKTIQSQLDLMNKTSLDISSNRELVRDDLRE
jgi:hypothetical protein